MKKKISLLMVDDHPFILQAYKNTLKEFKKESYEISTIEAENGESGYHAIINSQQPFDVALLDISIPPFLDKNIFSGEDLAKLLRTEMPDCQIFLLTMHTEKLRFNKILDEINPEALVIKNDLNFEELIQAFDRVLNGKNYYSETVLKMLKDQNDELND